jgi:ComEC/Rec2-related protein
MRAGERCNKSAHAFEAALMHGRLGIAWAMSMMAALACGYTGGSRVAYESSIDAVGPHLKLVWGISAAACLVVWVWLARSNASLRERGAAIVASVVLTVGAGQRGFDVRRGDEARRDAWEISVRAAQRARAERAGEQELFANGEVFAMRVQEASYPGNTCRFLATLEPANVRLLVDLREDQCIFAQGQRILVAREELQKAAMQWPLSWRDDPISQALLNRFSADGRIWLNAYVRSADDANPYWLAIARLRFRAFVMSQGRPDIGFATAAGIGLASALDAQSAEELRLGGLNHLVAVSGQQVGLAAALLQALALRLLIFFGQRPRSAIVAASLAMWTYVALSGAVPSALRAGVMTQIFYLGRWYGRPTHGPGTLVIAAAAMVLHTPSMIQDIGFQLSVVAMYAVFGLPRDSGVVEQTWRMSWALAPLSLWYFGTASLAGVVANIVAVPVFAAWILPWTILGFVSEPWLGEAMLAPARWGSQLVLFTGKFVSKIGDTQGSTWIVLSGAVLLLHLVVWLVSRYSQGGAWLFRIARILPGAALTVVVAIAAWLGGKPRIDAVASDGVTAEWVLLGNARNQTCVTASLNVGTAQSAERPIAAILNAQGAPATWPALLIRLGFAGVSQVRAPNDPTYQLRLQAEFERAQMWFGPSSRDANAQESVVSDDGQWALACPDAALARRAMVACQRHVGADQVSVRSVNRQLSCWNGRFFSTLDLKPESGDERQS